MNPLINEFVIQDRLILMVSEGIAAFFDFFVTNLLK